MKFLTYANPSVYMEAAKGKFNVFPEILKYCDGSLCPVIDVLMSTDHGLPSKSNDRPNLGCYPRLSVTSVEPE